jgi:1,4-dihydroxy-2-naphthoate polyprenyltransferase
MNLKSVVQHLRFPFSFLLLPIFLFALTQFTELIFNPNTWLLFFILHFLIYPSSNAFNSIQDKDEGSIGLVESPLPIDASLNYICILFDVLGIILGLFISLKIAICITIYVMASRLYSFRKVRLKQYPILGFLTVFIFQGAWIFIMVLNLNIGYIFDLEYMLACIASSCLIGCMYPLSQIYQHKQDKADGVTTISMQLGYNGTFVFSAILFTISGVLLSIIFYKNIVAISIIASASIIVGAYFFYWWYKVSHATSQANFKNTMRMNVISCIAFNLAFLLILIFTLWHISTT